MEDFGRYASETIPCTTAEDFRSATIHSFESSRRWPYTIEHRSWTNRYRWNNSDGSQPGEAHQISNHAANDLILYVVADNPIGESHYFPDSKKWGVGTPERRLIRSEPLDYFDGEE